MLKNKRITVIFLLFLAVVFLWPNVSLAQIETYFGVNDILEGGAYLSDFSFRQAIAAIINIVLGFIGVIFTVIIIYGGFVWMLSGGSPEKVTKGKNTLTWAAIGLVVIFSSYALVNFVLKGLASTGT